MPIKKCQQTFSWYFFVCTDCRKRSKESITTTKHAKLKLKKVISMFNHHVSYYSFNKKPEHWTGLMTKNKEAERQFEINKKMISWLLQIHIWTNKQIFKSFDMPLDFLFQFGSHKFWQMCIEMKVDKYSERFSQKKLF